MGKARIRSAILRAGMVLSGLALIGLSLSDGITIGSGESAIDVVNPRIPLILLFVFIFLYALTYSEGITSMCRRLDSDESEPRDRRFVAIFLGALLLIGFSLRIARLNEFGFSIDEAIFAYTASADGFIAVLKNTELNAHPPANFLMLHLLMKVSWDPLWLRMGSLLTGTYAIWITYMFGRRLIGVTAGLMMAVLVTWSPSLILLSRVIRNYSPGIALLITALYFLVRFIKEDRWAFFYGFAFFEFLAATWLYNFVIVFAGVNITLAAVLLRRRCPPSSWIKVLLAQTPLVVGLGIALLVHLPRMPTFHLIEYMDAEYKLPLDRIWLPVLRLSRYLLTHTAGAIFFVLAGVGALTLWLNGRRWELLLCIAPIPFAYAFALAGKIPFGGTRHSFYLFPFLFALMATQAPEFISGFQTVRGGMMRWGIGRSEKRPTDRTGFPYRGGLARFGLLALISIGFFYAYSALGLVSYNEPYGKSHLMEHREWLPYYNTRFYKLPEAPTLRADQEIIWKALKRNAGPDDIVLLTYQSLLIMRFYLDPRKPMAFDVDAPIHFRRDGINFYYTPASSWGFYTAEEIVMSVADACDRFGIEDVGKVWIPHAGWEVWQMDSYTDMIRRDYPKLFIDDPAVTESRGLVFPLDGPRARDLGARLLDEVGEREEL